MTPAQQLEYAQQALDSGDAAAIAAAYEAIAAAATANPADAALQYSAAQLALELSGVGDVFTSGAGTVDPLAISSQIFAGIDLPLLGQAGDYLLAASAGQANLSSTDYLVGAVGLLISGAPAPADPAAAPDIVATLDQNANLGHAQDFLAAGIAELPVDDPARAILQSLLDTIQPGSTP
jgi:hypothetical protein